jgi:hypothetical protein
MRFRTANLGGDHVAHVGSRRIGWDRLFLLACLSTNASLPEVLVNWLHYGDNTVIAKLVNENEKTDHRQLRKVDHIYANQSSAILSARVLACGSSRTGDETHQQADPSSARKRAAKQWLSVEEPPLRNWR